MKTVEVIASRTYSVQIGTELLSRLGTEVANLIGAEKAVIVSDSHVWPLYGAVAAASLSAAGITALSWFFPAGEESKCGTVYLTLLNFLAENHITRSDCLIALGGGVTGDLTGFAAATYLRGVRCIQVPTTLLAAVDSSVGGKTAIDLPAGKNLAGAFFQPSLVLCDLCTLDSLPEDIFLDGCAEVIKYGILYDPALFSHLEQHGPAFDREAVISRCVSLKRDVVAEDEFDTGARQKLNLGHTIGHGIEHLSNFSISHGQAVAAGMATMARAAAAAGFCSVETSSRIVRLLAQFSLPTSTVFDAESLCLAALSDKKRTGQTVNLVIPRAIGHCEILPMPVAQLCKFIKAGL